MRKNANDFRDYGALKIKHTFFFYAMISDVVHILNWTNGQNHKMVTFSHVLKS